MLSFTSLAMRLFVFSLFLLIPVSKAADWSLIGKSTNGHQYFLDTASIEFGTANPSDPSYYQANSKNSIGFWVKTLYKYNKGTPIAAMEKYGGYRIWYTLTRYTASCDTNYLSYEDNVIYGLSHQILDKDYLGTGSRPVPDSIEDHIFNVVCRINRKHLAESEELKFKERAPERLSPQRADFGFSETSDFGPYNAELQRRIRRNWVPPVEDRNKEIIASFTILRGGRLSNLVVKKSSGSASADQAALAAVRASAPFRQLPPVYAGKSINVDFKFNYEMYGHGEATVTKE